MLFQPTNIFPSTRGGLGNGTVDATKALKVTWQINGNSALTAFSITIYANDANSTQKYTTGKITSGCPFYGTDYAGNIQFFSYTISASTLSSNGITNGNEYKLIIQQWWSASESVTQTSAAAFITRKTPTLTMNAISSPLAVRSYTFGATYSQAQGDALNWVRWMLAYAGDTDNPIYDSQNIYGTAQLAMTYDGLFKDTSYAVRCMIQTENGVEADTGWTTFSVSYSSQEIPGAIVAQKSCGRSAIELSWPALQYIPATMTGTYSRTTSGMLVLNSGASAVWNEVNGSSMSFAPPWTLFYKTQLIQGSSTLLTIAQSGGNIVAEYDTTSRDFTVSIGSDPVYIRSSTLPTAQIIMVLTDTHLYVSFQESYGGLYPSKTLYPETTLYPEDDNTPVVTTAIVPLSYTQSAVTSLTLGQNQACSYLQFTEGIASQEDIDSAYIDDTYAPTYSAGDYFCTNFYKSLNGGNFEIVGDNVVGLAVYRQEGSDTTLQHLGDYPLGVSSMFDYGTTNGAGPYLYYLFPIGETAYSYDPIESNLITMCDWNWTLLECSEREEGEGFYNVDAEFQFGKNLSSGSVSNNNAPNLLENFTPYPTVQLSSVNYKSGTLQSLIGKIDYTCQNEYSDSIPLRDAIYALSTSTKALFLKSRKGDLFRVRVSGAITMNTMDGTREQAQSVNLPWVEVGDADGVSITATQSPLWSGGEAV